MSNRQIACFLLSYSRRCGAVSFAANLQQRMDPAIPRGRVSKNICHWWELHVLDDVTAPLVKTRRNCRSRIRRTVLPTHNANRKETMTNGSGRILPRGGAAVILGVTSLSTIGAIAYSHYAQVRDRKVMKEGVERDKERLAWKRRQQKDGQTAEQS
jgi:predicted alpha-1,6-mannanase (GH76 family)